MLALLARSAILFVLILSNDAAFAQPALREPGGTPSDVDLAINNPDEFAWQLFLFLSRQGATGSAGAPDPTKSSLTQYDPDKPVVWETWALASGSATSQDGSEVYKPKGEKPVGWSDLPRGTQPAKIFSARIKTSISPKGLLLLSSPLDPLGQEVRMNEAAYTFIRDKDLYSADGLEAKLLAAQKIGDPNLIKFPKGAKEIKAQWALLDMAKEQQEKARYHWRTVDGTAYKLVAMHIITKDLPAWFWCDYVHVDYEDVNTKLPSRDVTTRPEPGGAVPPFRGNVDGERKETTGSKWANYRLRGTQTSFVDPRGEPIILGNSQIETELPDQSSCMGCHARATIGLRSSSNKTISHLPGGEDGNVRPPNPDLFGTANSIKFLQNDFVWSGPTRAQPKQ
jgi:hypothetical protein